MLYTGVNLLISQQLAKYLGPGLATPCWCHMDHENCSTGYSVNMMMLLMDTFQPVDILMDMDGTSMRDENPSEYLHNLCQTLQEVHKLASEVRSLHPKEDIQSEIVTQQVQSW